jgi:hypothetical protein
MFLSILSRRLGDRLRSLFAVFICSSGLQMSADDSGLSYNRDVRPLLSDRCFHCHGPDDASRKAKLRLDVRESAVESAIVPGNAIESELLLRISTGDEDDLMPPPDSGTKQLSESEIKILRDWIEAGAEYEKHWSFEPISRPPLPEVVNSDWVKNPIDHFVLARLEEKGWEPSIEASARMLSRRVSLDLNGLPPSVDQVRTFEDVPTDRAYEQFVDRLLASKRFGERMAMVWLDAARYADTDGFQADATRSNWAWRDWVIESYNNNIPFDQFTIEQFAGDLLPEANQEQILATCFHRNHMANGEGGRDPEESRVDYVIDRVNTMGTVWLGLTLGCAQCHNHKFDPISQKEYYQFNAFFNSVDEDGKAGGGAKPFLEYQSPFVGPAAEEAGLWLALKEREFEGAESQTREEFDVWLAERVAEVREGHRSWSLLPVTSLSTTSSSEIRLEQDGQLVVSGVNPRHDDYVIHARPELDRITGIKLEVLPIGEGQGYSEAEDGHVILTNVKFGVRTEGRTQLKEIEVISAVADYQNQKKGARDYGLFRDVLDDDPRTGWTTNGSDKNERRVGVFQFASPVELAKDEELVAELRHRSLKGNSSIRRFRLLATNEAGPAVSSVDVSPREQLAASVSKGVGMSDAIQDLLWDEFVEDQSHYQESKKARSDAQGRVATYDKARKAQRVMVLSERKEERETNILIRGVWDQKGEAVHRGLPAALYGEADDSSLTRKELAEWLVDERNPLTARVTVNRYWQMYFGNGLVRTPEDFGMQGEPPTHPQLLDWLAAEFIDSGWDVKHLQKLIVTSATYRQSSDSTEERIVQDPENRLLARATRFRLPSWMIRDVALASAGLLVNRLGGPPVYPHQPPGLWADSTMGRFHYQHSVGSDLYRRSVYGFWRRSVGPALMFDASKRRVCQVRVTRTSTPLQALTLMNDRTFIEAGCQLALADVAGTVESVASLFESVLSREPSPSELMNLTEQYRDSLNYYLAHVDDARALLGHVGEEAPTEGPSERAALAIVAMTILNLDEAITRQ